MSNTLIDLFNGLLKYDGKEIYFIVDDDETVWFSAANVAKILGYTDIDQAIRKNVKEKNQVKYKKIRKFVKNPPKYMKPHIIFINESGLYSLVFSSKKPLAEEFRDWVTSEVLPSIRKTGTYRVSERMQKELDAKNEKLKKSRREIRILKHNQKKGKYGGEGVIYIVRPIDTTKKGYLKPGKSKQLEKRLRTYNTSVPDDMELLFVYEVNDPDAVEMCLKGVLNNCIYRKNKEFYKCTIKKMKQVIKMCDKLVSEEYICEKCQTKVYANANEHMRTMHGVTDHEELYVTVSSLQNGGDKNEHEVLATVPVEKLAKMEAYCARWLYSFYDHHKEYYECKASELFGLLSQFGVDYLVDSLRDNNDEVVLLEFPDNHVGGGDKITPSLIEELTKKLGCEASQAVDILNSQRQRLAESDTVKWLDDL